MLAFYDDPLQRYKVAVLLQLETEAKARLRPVIMSLGLDPTELEESRRAGHKFAESLAGLEWTEAMARLRDGVKPYVDRYIEVETRAPAEYREAAHAMVVHEQSFTGSPNLRRLGTQHIPLTTLLPNSPTRCLGRAEKDFAKEKAAHLVRYRTATR